MKRKKTSSRSGTYRLKILGQHFLNNRLIAGRIVEALGPLDQAHVLEIGAGRGILSCLLADRAASFTALELDSRLSEELARKLKGRESVAVVRQDALEFDIESWIAGCGPLNPVIVGNIPYRITRDLLHKLIGCHRHLSVAVLMVQEEVAR